MPRYKRAGALTDTDKELVARVVLDQPNEVRPEQVRALARALRRSPVAIEKAVADARQNFVQSAPEYVEMHMQATKQALLDGDNETVVKATQWAMEHVSDNGQRIIEKEAAAPTGSRIMIGIRVGGVNQDAIAVELPPAPVESTTE